MILWPGSKRSVKDFRLAAEIAAAAREGGAEPVGVFVDESPEQARAPAAARAAALAVLGRCVAASGCLRLSGCSQAFRHAADVCTTGRFTPCAHS